MSEFKLTLGHRSAIAAGDVRERELGETHVLVALVVDPTRLAVLPRSDRSELLLESLESGWIGVVPLVFCRIGSPRTTLLARSVGERNPVSAS